MLIRWHRTQTSNTPGQAASTGKALGWDDEVQTCFLRAVGISQSLKMGSQINQIPYCPQHRLRAAVEFS